MKLFSIPSFVSFRFSLPLHRYFAEAPHDAGPPRNIVAAFIAGARARYEAKKKNRPPGDQRFRLSPFYLLVAVFIALLLQNLLGGSHVEVISYSQFKSLLKNGLVAEAVIHGETIEGNLKGGAAKEIYPPEKLKNISPDVMT